MEIINNVNRTLKDDLTLEIHRGSKVSIAAACFSIYAFEELKKELENIDELRFIFTSPTFVAEKTRKKKESFIFLVLIVNAVCMELSLKLSSEMK